MHLRFLLFSAAFLLVSPIGLAEQTSKVEVGGKAPDFTSTGIDGKDFKLSDKMGKDKNIVLMFSRAHW